MDSLIYFPTFLAALHTTDRVCNHQTMETKGSFKK
jgi:hypothetical protein